jgi:hypothetical protein
MSRLRFLYSKKSQSLQFGTFRTEEARRTDRDFEIAAGNVSQKRLVGIASSNGEALILSGGEKPFCEVVAISAHPCRSDRGREALRSASSFMPCEGRDSMSFRMTVETARGFQQRVLRAEFQSSSTHLARRTHDRGSREEGIR